MSPHRLRTLGSGLALTTLTALPLHAGPEAPTVVSGSATVDMMGRNTVITTQSARTILEFNQFNLGSRDSVRFDQPTSESAVLNRITGGQLTNIFGTVTSNGQVFFVNPAGITFSNTSTVNVARLVAAAGNISDSDFLAGIDRFTDSRAFIRNDSVNLVGREGVVLVGERVFNRGVISSEGGAIILASGNDFLIQESPDDQIMIRVEGFGAEAPESFGSRVNNFGTIDSGEGGQVLLGAGDLLGLARTLRDGQINTDQLTLDFGDQPVYLSDESSAFSNVSDDATLIINASEVSLNGDVAPLDRLWVNVDDPATGFTDTSGNGNLPMSINGLPTAPGVDPGDPGDDDGVDPGDPGVDPGDGDGVDPDDGDGLGDPLFDSTFVDAYARALPADPLAVASVSPATVDAALAAALQNNLGIEVKEFEEEPLLEYLVAATVLDDLNLSDTDNTNGFSQVSVKRLDYATALSALNAYDDVFNKTDTVVDQVAASQSAAADQTANAEPSASTNLDQTQRVRSLIQQSADRYMADAEVTELDPVAFVEWLQRQDSETLEALAGLDELVNNAVPNLGLGASELDNFKAWTYGKIAPQGVSLRTLDEVVATAGRN